MTPTLNAKIRTALLAALLLAACGEKDPEIRETIASQDKGFDTYRVKGWNDPESGCKYFVASTYRVTTWIITPRYWSNGQPMCPGNKP